ncbi:MAG: homocitrate synthase [Anaerolineaceae bacterium]|nr:homocitrate synthase [Anaerolineaceae bacterium]MCY3906106.1 homocitrate synthase [Anaerolineaceae bacterium]
MQAASFSNFNVIESTLREGEQFEGCHFTLAEKLEIAAALDAFGVEYMELTTPLASPQSEATLRAVAGMKRRFRLLTHIRARMDEARLAVDCGVDGVDIYIGTSAYMRQFSHGRSLQEIIDSSSEIVAWLKDQDIETRFSTEDTFRSNLADVFTVYRAMDLAGVDRVGVADTVGIADPLRTHSLISSLRQAVHCDIEFHGHDDSGCAVANAWCALQAGATHVDTTVLGIGERNGITALGGLVARIYTVDPQLVRKYDLPLLREIEDLVARRVGIDVPFNTPITGRTAFHHKAGVHTNAVLQNPTSYEAIDPEDFGIARNIDVAHRLVGWNAVRDRAATLGMALDEPELRAATRRIKALADERRITLADVDKVLQDAVTEPG